MCIWSLTGKQPATSLATVVNEIEIELLLPIELMYADSIYYRGEGVRGPTNGAPG